MLLGSLNIPLTVTNANPHLSAALPQAITKQMFKNIQTLSKVEQKC